jgi:hypothetical protein
VLCNHLYEEFCLLVHFRFSILSSNVGLLFEHRLCLLKLFQCGFENEYSELSDCKVPVLRLTNPLLISTRTIDITIAVNIITSATC